jgi:hypothetical protein
MRKQRRKTATGAKRAGKAGPKTLKQAKLRVLCVADSHSSNAALYAIQRLVSITKPDLILVAGDITHRGSALYASDFLHAIGKAVKANGLQTRVFAVHGNIDPAEVQKLLEQRKVSIHNKTARFAGYVFVGFGGSTHTPNATPCEYPESDVKSALEKLVTSKTILLTHAPPYGTKADWTGSVHSGSRALREIIEERQPRACVCAHAHEAKGVEKLAGTRIIKVPPLNAGEAVFLELPSLKARFIKAA